MKRFNQTTLFLILTFVISFSMAAAYQLLTGGAVGTISYTILGATYMFVPALSVVIVKKLIFKEKLRSDMQISFKINKWFFAAWLIMPLSAFLTLGVSLLFPGVSYNPDMTGLAERFASMTSPEQLEEMKVQLATLPVSPIWLILLMGLVAGITVNGLAAYGEELGWRGFLLYQFRTMNFMKASLLIGSIWGIWHAPLILMGHNYPQHPQIGVLMMTVLCILLTPLLLYFTIKSKSVIAAAIAHGTMNATATISIIPITGGNDLLVGMPGLAGMIAVMILTIGLFIYDRYISKENIMTKNIQQ
ncbi:MAG: CPBP family intramembrane glutamic endopeptidase [Paludibacter sp.]|jgi:membrane protease YdiL (CAAX protease family)|nr:CPBP family intramembrane glutamic endopeptidase [Paludibacter sp.]